MRARSLQYPALVLVALAACSTIPEPKMSRYTFPKDAFIGDIQRPYAVLGPVRSKVDYPSLDPNHDESALCKNYYNKAVRELVKFSKQQGGDAVIDVESVVFLEDGRREVHKTPECSDDGGEGQVLTQGIAVKWKGGDVEKGSWTQPEPARPKLATQPEPQSWTGAEATPAVPQPAPAPVSEAATYAESASVEPVASEQPKPAETSAVAPVESVPFSQSSAIQPYPAPAEGPARIQMEPAAEAAPIQRVAPPRARASRPSRDDEPASPPARLNLADPRFVRGL